MPSTTSPLLPYEWNIDGVVNCVARSGNTIYFGGDFSIVDRHAGAGVPMDPSTGAISASFPVVDGINAVVYAAADDGAGGWYIGGDFSTVGGLPRSRLAHVLADGTVAAWNPGAGPYNVHAVARQGNVVYVGGDFSTIGGQRRNGLAAVDGRTGAVLSWDPAIDGEVEALVISNDTLYVGGGFSTILGQPRAYLASVDTRTGALTSWDPHPDGYILCLAVHGNVAYAGGYFMKIGGAPRIFLGAVDAHSGVATGWDPKVVPSTYDYYLGWAGVFAIAATDRSVYVGGYFLGLGGAVRTSIAAVDPSTGKAQPWNPPLWGGFYAEIPEVFAIDVSGPNVLVGGGFYGDSGHTTSNFIVADAVTGRVRPWSTSADLGVTVIEPGRDHVLIGGAFRTFEDRRRCLASLDATTGALTPWNSSFRGTRVNALTVHDSVLFVGGAFSEIAGRGGENLAAINTQSGAPAIFGGSTDGEVRALLVHDSRLFLGGSFTQIWDRHLVIPGPQRKGIGAYDLGTGSWAVVSPWDPEADGEVDALAADDSTLYVGGRFGEIGGQARSFVASLDFSTAEATGWDPSANGPVSALAVGGGVVFAGGGFSSVGAEPRSGLASLDSRTGLATAWDPEADARVDALDRQGDILYVGGMFHSVGGVARSHMAALRASTGLVLPWDPEANGDARAIMAKGQTVFAGGAFTSVDGVAREGLVALEPATVRSRGGSAPISIDGTRAPTLSCTPNLVRSDAIIDFTVPAPAFVTLAIYDLAGRRVVSPIAGHMLSAGVQQVLVDTRAWPVGCYFCRLTVGRASLEQKIVRVR